MNGNGSIPFTNITESNNKTNTSTISFSLNNRKPATTNNGVLGNKIDKKRKLTDDDNDSGDEKNIQITSTDGISFQSLSKQPIIQNEIKVIPLNQQIHTFSKDDNNNNKDIEKQSKTPNIQSIINGTDEHPKKKLKTEEDKKEASFYNPTQNGLQIKKQSIQNITKSNQDIEMKDKEQPIPLILKLEGLENFKDDTDKFKYDVESRPDECDLAEYDQTPLSIFGEAMLRGQGWEPGKPIGLTNKSVVKPIEINTKRGYSFGLGATPESILKAKNTPTNNNTNNNNNSNKNNNNNNIIKEKEQIYSETWLRPNLVVKIISKSLGDGKYYLKNGLVLDIFKDKICTLKLVDNGRVIENVKERMVETAIPQVKGSILIVNGKHKGKSGILIDRKRLPSKDIAVVAVDNKNTFELELDDICHYQK